ncbi:MAG: hypothetical protein CMH55_11080, partial [Myxococcales bacterium]|nr:hypothetical protein [Myxococcales bacterium]
AVLVTGMIPGWTLEDRDRATQSLIAAEVAPVFLQDPGVSEEIPDGAKVLVRPIQFPAAAVQLGERIRDWFEEQLCRREPNARETLKERLKLAGRLESTGIYMVEAPLGRGEIHLRGGRLVQTRLSGLTGPEAFAVLLALDQGESYLEPRKNPEAGQGKNLKSWVAEAETIELHVAQLLDGAPKGPLDVAPERLLSRLSLLSDQVSWILRLIDGQRDLEGVRLIGGRRALEGSLSLLEDGILIIAQPEPEAEDIPPVADEAALPPQMDEDEVLATPAEPEVEEVESDLAWSLAMAQVPESAGQGDWESLPELQDDDADALTDPIEPLLSDSSEDSLLFSLPPAVDDESAGFDGESGAWAVDERDLVESGLPPPIEADDEAIDELPPVFDRVDDVPEFLETRDMAPLTEELPPAPPVERKGLARLRTSDEILADEEAMTSEREVASEKRWDWRWIAAAVALFGLLVTAIFIRNRRIKGEKGGLLAPIIRTFSSPEPLPPLEPLQRPELEGDAKKRKAGVKTKRRLRPKKRKKRRVGTGPFAKSMTKAREARDQGDLDAAEKNYRRALKMRASKKNKALAYYELGEALETGGDTPAAKKAYSRAIQANGKLIPAYKALGYLELKAFKNNDQKARKRALKHLGVAKRLLGNRPDPTLDDWLDQLQ